MALPTLASLLPLLALVSALSEPYPSCSSVPPCSNCGILGVRALNGTLLGYLSSSSATSPDYYTTYITPCTSAVWTVNLPANTHGTFSLAILSPTQYAVMGWGWLGAQATDQPLKPGVTGSVMLLPTAKDNGPGPASSSLPNPSSDPAESSIWQYNYETNELEVHWTNTDGSSYPNWIMYDESLAQFYATADVDLIGFPATQVIFEYMSVDDASTVPSAAI